MTSFIEAELLLAALEGCRSSRPESRPESRVVTATGATTAIVKIPWPEGVLLTPPNIDDPGCGFRDEARFLAFV